MSERRRSVATRSAIAVVGVSVVLVAASCGSPPQSNRSTSDRVRGVDVWTGYGPGWTKLPAPPEVRDGAAFVWTGSEVIAWGGCSAESQNSCEATADGFAFDPVAGSWQAIPAAPDPGAYATGVRSGNEVLFVPEEGGHGDEVLAFEPAVERWHRLPAAPLDFRSGSVAVWTGSELILWGGGGRDDPSAKSGAAYEPLTDSWRRIADAPLGLNLASGMWTGNEMLVFGSLLDGRNTAETRTSVGAAYDPASDRWRELPPSELSPQATAANFVDGRMVAWDYEVHSQEFDPHRNAWSDPARMPMDFSECYPDSVVTQGRVFAFFCGDASLYEVASGTWKNVRGGPLIQEISTEANTYPRWRFASLVGAGEIVFLALEGITIEDGMACYGCPGSPHAFYAFRQPVRP